MWNKICLIFLIGGLACSLSAQSSRYGRRNRNWNRTRNTSVQQQTADKKSENRTSAKKKDVPKTARPPAPEKKFDPAKPQLTEADVRQVMDETIRKRLLECEIRPKLPGHKNDGEDSAGNSETPEENETPEDGRKPENGKKTEKYVFLSRLDFAILMSEYQSLLDNFELIEVTRIRPEWYQQYQAELRKFGPVVNKMTIAVRTRSADRYAAAVERFQKQQEECLKFLKGKKPRISKEQYEALVQKNTKIRQQNYEKRIREERAAENRRKEELRKIRQQELLYKQQLQSQNKKIDGKK